MYILIVDLCCLLFFRNAHLYVRIENSYAPVFDAIFNVLLSEQMLEYC